MRYWFAFICVLALVGAASAGQFKAKLDVDAYVDKNNPEESYSSGDVLWATSVKGTPVNETYLGFINTFGSEGIFSPKNIESATLKVYASEVEKPGKVEAYLLHGATLETLTWEDKEEYYGNVSATANITEAGEYTLDITPLIKKAVETCTEGCPYSIVLVADGDASVGFASVESGKAATLQYTTGE